MNSALPMLALLRDGERDPNRLRLFDLVIAEVARIEARLRETEAALAAQPRGQVIPLRPPGPE